MLAPVALGMVAPGEPQAPGQGGPGRGGPAPGGGPPPGAALAGPTINGAGASFPASIYQRWFQDYAGVSGDRVNYQSVAKTDFVIIS